MAILGGKEVQVDDGGYLLNSDEWDMQVAEDIASSLSITLTEKHLEVVNFLREKHKEGVEMSLRKLGKSGVVTIKELYVLFPGGPLKNAAKIAGLKRPTSCV